MLMVFGIFSGLRVRQAIRLAGEHQRRCTNLILRPLFIYPGQAPCPVDTIQEAKS